jgi:hypothetical protein
VVLSAFALQNLFVSAPGNEDFAEATEEMTQATETTEETTTLQGGGDLKTPPDSKLSYGEREVRSSASGSYCWVWEWFSVRRQDSPYAAAQEDAFCTFRLGDGVPLWEAKAAEQGERHGVHAPRQGERYWHKTGC